MWRSQDGDEKQLYLFYALIYLLFYSYVSLTTLRLVWNTGLGDYTRVLMPQLGAMASGILCLITGASRTRAVSLLTGGLVPQLALYLLKRNPPKQSIVTVQEKPH